MTFKNFIHRVLKSFMVFLLCFFFTGSFTQSAFSFTETPVSVNEISINDFKKSEQDLSKKRLTPVFTVASNTSFNDKVSAGWSNTIGFLRREGAGLRTSFGKVRKDFLTRLEYKKAT